MELIIRLDPETARQLDAIQQHTNQEQIEVIRQGIGLYYQQLQPHHQFYIETKKQYDLIYTAPAVSSVN
jgi:predicted transcriptional regulator